jgi:hypothetical protein
MTILKMGIGDQLNSKPIIHLCASVYPTLLYEKPLACLRERLRRTGSRAKRVYICVPYGSR